MIDRAAQFFSTCRGYKKYLLAFAMGALLTLALPPFGFFPIIFIAIPALLWLTAAAETWPRAFLTGWVFGGGFFIVGLHWFAVAFKTFFGYMLWFMPFAVIVIPMYIALYYGLAAALAWPFRRHRWYYAVVFAVLLFWAEYLRAHYLTNFPWNAVGYAWHHVLPVLQSVTWFGIYGLTFLTLFWAVTPLLSRRVAALSALSFAFVLGFGVTYLHLSPTQLTPHLVRIVQPNITQADKEDVSLKDDLVLKQARIASQPSPHLQNLTYVIWPETAIDVMNAQDRKNISRLSHALPPQAIGLIGVNRMARGKDAGPRNSLIGVNAQGKLVAQHDKFILAPWGEYIPYADFVMQTPLKNMLSMQSLTPGEGPSTIQIHNLPSFSPIICFEATFAGQMINRYRPRPEFLLFITNDAWSMGSNGPYQHFGFARVRAIEEGLPIVRAANTGISATIDAQGRVLTQMALSEEGVIDTALPQAGRPTPYSVTGDMPLLYMMLGLTFSLLLGSYFLRRRD